MSDQIWVGLILLLCWLAMPLSLIIANWQFDGHGVTENPRFDQPDSK